MQNEQNTISDLFDVTQGVIPDTIVVHCGQPDLQEAFEKFIDEKLGLKKGQYALFVVPGGAGALGRPNIKSKAFKFMKEGLELYGEHFKSIKRIILINHESCAYYKELSEALGSLLPFHAHVAQDDMKLISQVFASLLSHLGVKLEMYYAKFAGEDHKQVTFEKVE